MCRKESSKERDFKELIKIRNFAEFWLGMYKFHKSVCFYNYSDSIFLGDTLADLGFEMDSGKSYYEKFGETHLPDIDVLQHYMPEMDIQLLGNLIFSQWRRWNHWSDYEIMEEKDFQWFVIAFERLADLATERGGTNSAIHSMQPSKFNKTKAFSHSPIYCKKSRKSVPKEDGKRLFFN